MLSITCSGTSDEVGYQHGLLAKDLISQSINFYAAFFLSQSKMTWSSAQQFAAQYIPYLSSACPELLAEMQGVARGADVPLLSILALNVRTEIAFGKYSDGCTALAWSGDSSLERSSNGDHSGDESVSMSDTSTPSTTILAQNWDWDVRQGQNLISLTIRVVESPESPWISMITEAGIIGKIGLSSNGVGCTLNAIRARGAATDKLPCHVALRTALSSPNAEAASSVLEECGVASACHILVADFKGAIGLECSSEDVVRLEMSPKGVLTHTNHYLKEHAPAVQEKPDWMPDSQFRLNRINELVQQAVSSGNLDGRTVNGLDEDKTTTKPRADLVEEMLKDGEVEEEAKESGKAAAICRKLTPNNNICTLFSIVMDLENATARVAVGRPNDPEEIIELKPREATE